jgi:ADP-ribose pyrophosphatase
MFTEKQITSKIVYNGIVVNVKRDTAELHNGNTANREVVIHPGGIVILPVDDMGNAYVVRQFRYPPMKPLLEACAGKLEKGEDPKAAAVRELYEETGITAAEIIGLGISYPSPGYCDEVNYHYLAKGLTVGTPHPDEDEFLTVEKFPLSELLQMAANGELNDGKTIVTLFRADRLLNGGQITV